MPRSDFSHSALTHRHATEQTRRFRDDKEHLPSSGYKLLVAPKVVKSHYSVGRRPQDVVAFPDVDPAAEFVQVRAQKFASDAQAADVIAPYAEAIDTLTRRMTWRDRLQAWLVRALRTLKGWLAGT